jgi:CheY-like chemotaxis protein
MALQPATILVVDDESNVAEALWQLLRIHEYEVQHCTSASEALNQIDLKHFDLIISDLRMPGMDGLELLERVGKRQPTIRKILITAYDSPELRFKIKNIVHAYLPKPFTLRHFLDVVQQEIETLGEIPKATPRQTYPRLLHKIGARRVDQALRQGSTSTLAKASNDNDEEEDNPYQILEHLLEVLQLELGADIVFVADLLGQILAEVGYAQNHELAELVPLISASFASIFELGNLLDGDEAAPCLWYREGQIFDIYTVNICQHCFLVVLMGKKHATVRTGMVWLAMKRAIQELKQQIDLEQLALSSQGEIDSTLATAIVDDLDRLFEFEQ